MIPKSLLCCYCADIGYREGTTGRALTTGMAVPGGASKMSVALCTSACGAAGFSLSGVEYAQECCKTPPSYERE